MLSLHAQEMVHGRAGEPTHSRLHHDHVRRPAPRLRELRLDLREHRAIPFHDPRRDFHVAGIRGVGKHLPVVRSAVLVGAPHGLVERSVDDHHLRAFRPDGRNPRRHGMAGHVDDCAFARLPRRPRDGPAMVSIGSGGNRVCASVLEKAVSGPRRAQHLEGIQSQPL